MAHKSPPHLFEISLEEMSALDPTQHLICDLRMPEEFAANHLLGTINLPLRPHLAHWAADLIDVKTPLHLLVKNKTSLSRAFKAFQQVGIHVQDYALINHKNWQHSSLLSSSFPMITPEQALKGYYILDVRTPAERKILSIDGSIGIELGTLGSHLHELPTHRQIAIICRSGSRSSIAASLLKRAGFSDVSNIQGGMEAWSRQFPKTA